MLFALRSKFQPTVDWEHEDTKDTKKNHEDFWG